MPYKSKKPCQHPGCPKFADTGNNYCERHGRLFEMSAPPPKKEHRESSSRRGYGRRWQKIRLVFLRRNPMCCASGCKKLATEVDHIKSLADGGLNYFYNLQGFCKKHHSVKTIKFDGGFGRKKKKRKFIEL